MAIAPRRAELLVGEPLVLAIRFKNVAKATRLMLCGPLEQRGDRLNIGIGFSHKGVDYNSEPPMVADYYDIAIALALDPGDSVEVVYVAASSYLTSYDPRRSWKQCEPWSCWDLPRPGIFMVSCSYNPPFAQVHGEAWQGHVTVMGAHLEVKKCKKGEDKEGLKQWSQAQSAASMWREPHGKFSADAFMAGRLTQSRYAPYAIYLSALSSRDVGFAESRLMFLAREYPEFILRDEVLFDLAGAQRKLGQDAEANATLEAASRANPISVRSRKYERLPDRPH